MLSILAGAVACGGGSTPHVASAIAAGASHPSGAGTRASHRSTTQLIHTAAECLRQHGVPNFPDPILDSHGQIQIDDQVIKSVPIAVAQAAEHSCASQIDAAQAAAEAIRPVATAQEIQQATQFAHCMRQHGWPNFPDPDRFGKFTSNQPGATPATKNDPSFQTCRHLLTTQGR
jgi:hypothetical protein